MIDTERIKCYNESNTFNWRVYFMKIIDLKPVETQQVVASKCNCGGASNCNCGAGSICAHKCLSGETVNSKDALKEVYSD